MRKPRIIAHAGGAGLGPENTLPAIRASLAHGVDGIEVDVRATADGVPVLLHDETVDRTTDGTGRVDALSVAAVCRLDAAHLWRSRASSVTSVPDLASVLGEVRGRAVLALELKPAGIEESVIRVVREAGATAWVEVHSFLPSVLDESRRRAPEIPTVLIADEAPFDVVAMAQSPGAGGVALSQRLLRAKPDLLRRAQEAGLWCNVWTIDDVRDMAAFVQLGVDAIVTNRPDRLAMLLARQS